MQKTRDEITWEGPGLGPTPEPSLVVEVAL